jgi:hypothetical protein
MSNKLAVGFNQDGLTTCRYAFDSCSRTIYLG